ncbi:MAG: SIMPL domain-containing protein [Bacteroidetes bacterium]|nr:MAG: SIMPL domain-containing protein [Bacteroidota bacterium]
MNKTFLIVAVIFSTAVFSQAKNYLDKPYFEIRATADTLVTPDRIFIQINISESDTKGKISIEQLERKMYKTLKNIGIDTDENLRVDDMSSNYKKYLLKKKDILKSKSFSLMVEDAKTLSKVFMGLENIGISKTSIKRIEYSKDKEVQFLMKQKALKIAQKEAKLLTNSIGQKIGKAIFISAQSYPQNYARNDYQIRMKSEVAMAPAPPIDVEFKKMKISSSINIIFELQ